LNGSGLSLIAIPLTFKVKGVFGTLFSLAIKKKLPLYELVL